MVVVWSVGEVNKSFQIVFGHNLEKYTCPSAYHRASFDTLAEVLRSHLSLTFLLYSSYFLQLYKYPIAFLIPETSSAGFRLRREWHELWRRIFFLRNCPAKDNEHHTYVLQPSSGRLPSSNAITPSPSIRVNRGPHSAGGVNLGIFVQYYTKYK